MPHLLNEVASSAPAQNCQRLVLLGSAKVGKTAIVSRFLSNCFDEKYTPTIEDFHRKVYRIRGEAYRLDILDTSGNNPFPAMKRLSLLTGSYSSYLFIGKLSYCRPRMRGGNVLGRTSEWSTFEIYSCYYYYYYYYPYVPIGMMGIYRLLFLCFFLCEQMFCNGYLRRGLTQGDEI